MLDHPKTAYFRHVRLRPDRSIIQDEWITSAISDPEVEDRMTIHNAFFDQDFRSEAMKVKYFEGTDTALVEIGTTAAHETMELSPDLYIDLDADGRVVSITIEHASRQTDLSKVTFERVGTSPPAIRHG